MRASGPKVGSSRSYDTCVGRSPGLSLSACLTVFSALAAAQQGVKRERGKLVSHALVASQRAGTLVENTGEGPMRFPQGMLLQCRFHSLWKAARC